MADLQEFISAITTDKKRYCVVCFRTENERKLVAPEALAEFVKLSRLDKLSKRELVCIYCERQAEVALKLYKTLSFARNVNQMLWSLVNKKMSPRGIAYLLPGKVRGQNAGPGSVKRNKLLSLLRQYQTLSQTDVLVVDATAADMTTKKISDSDSIVIEDDDDQTPTVPRLVPIEKLLRIPPTEPTNNNLTTIETMSNMNPGSLVLYPVKTSNNSENQFLIVPEGANVKINGNALNVVNNGPTIPILLPNGNIVTMQPQNSSQIVLPITDNVIQNHPMTINKDLVCLNEQNTVEEIIMMDNRKIGEKVIKSKLLPKLANDNNIVQKNNVVNYAGTVRNVQNNINPIQYIPSNSVILPNNGSTIKFANVTSDQQMLIPMKVQTASEQNDSDQICQITNVRSDNICQISDLQSEGESDGTDMCQISDLRSLQEEVVVERPPEPKKKADPNIDWEDKIPMDVISFMDAKDPNAPNIRAPPPVQPPVPPPAPPTEPPRKSPAAPASLVLNHTLDHTMDLLTPLSSPPYRRSRRTKRRKGSDDDDLIMIN